jgi:hypothetical protein
MTATATKKTTVWDRCRQWEQDTDRREEVYACGDDLSALGAVCTLWTNELKEEGTSGSHAAAAESLVCRLAGYTNTPCGWLTPDGRYVHPAYGDLTNGYGNDEYDSEDEYDYEAELRYLNPWMAMEDDLEEYDY